MRGYIISENIISVILWLTTLNAHKPVSLAHNCKSHNLIVSNLWYHLENGNGNAIMLPFLSLNVGPTSVINLP